MSLRQATAPGGSTATTAIPIVTVDRVTDAHRALLSALPAGGFVVALYRGEALDIIPTLVAEDPQFISWLHTGAQQAAERYGYAHQFGCPWCHVNNCADRFNHEWLARSAESSWRELAS